MTAPVHILGDGILGLMIAATFMRKGQSVVVHASLHRRGASWHAGGMLAPAAESDCGSPLVLTLGQQALPLWRQWQSELNIGDAIAFRGSLMVAHTRDLPLLEDFLRLCQKATMPIESLSRPQLAALEPTLSERFPRALWLAQEGAVAPETVMLSLKSHLKDNGVTFETHEAWPDVPGSIRCLGLHDSAFKPGLRGLRGEALEVHAPDVKMLRPIRVMHPRYPLYIVPRPQQRYYIGATQIESEDLSPISVRSSLELLSAAASLDAGFLEARVEKSHVALRPTLSHGEPRIIKTANGLAVNGLYRHGILLAPIVAEHVTDWWLKGTPTPLYQPNEVPS